MEKTAEELSTKLVLLGVAVLRIQNSKREIETHDINEKKGGRERLEGRGEKGCDGGRKREREREKALA